MPFELPKLPYAYNALEPYIDAKTMEIHYTKHHQAYVTNLNAALESYPQGFSISLPTLLTQLDTLPTAIKTAVRNNGGGHLNHSLFWPMMSPAKKAMPQELAQLIDRHFGSFEQFKEQFNTAAKTVFGSGWAWLVLNGNKELEIMTTANQDNPCTTGKKAILGLDVWEHAYYLHYQNKRIDYITAWWSVVNWDFVYQLYTRENK